METSTRTSMEISMETSTKASIRRKDEVEEKTGRTALNGERVLTRGAMVLACRGSRAKVVIFLTTTCGHCYMIEDRPINYNININKPRMKKHSPL